MGRARRLLVLLAALAVAPAGACDEEPPVTLQAPRCEPDNEVQIERGLKRGYRALFEERPAEARAAFEGVLKRAPGHPQAQAGVAAARRAGARTPHPGAHRGGPLWVGGQPIWTALDVHGIRYRFEDRAAESALAHELGLCPAVPTGPPFEPRHAAGGGALPADEPVPTVEAVNLVILRDARALTTQAAFVHMLAEGRSVHLSIDWDGTVYQHLDLARAAIQPAGERAPDVSGRSVVVALVNPGAPESPPTPSAARIPPRARRDGGATGVTRELVQGTVQGHEVRSWSYTAAQRASLRQLLGALRTTLPGVPGRLPLTQDGEVARAALPAPQGESFQGIAGALHLDPEARDPGPGMAWDKLRDALER